MGSEAQSLYVVLTANATQYERILKSAKRDMNDFGDEVDRAGSRIDKTGLQVNQFSDRVGLALKAVTVFGPAIVQMGAVAVPVLTGLSSGLAMVVAGAGATVVAFQGVKDVWEALSKAQEDPTADNLAKARRELEGISPATASLVLHLREMLPELAQLRDATAEGTMPGFERGLENLQRLLPTAEAMLVSLGSTVGDVVDDSTASLASERWMPFFEFIQRESGPTLRSYSSIIGDLTHGLAELWQAMDPASDDFTSGLESAADTFDKWASSLEGSEGLDRFLDYLAESGPEAVEALASIGEGILDIAVATAPLQGPAMDALEMLADLVGFIADSPAGSGLLAYAAAMSAASLATKGFQSAGGPRVISQLKATGTGVKGVTADLGLMTRTWMTAGATSQREQARMTAAAQRLRGVTGQVARASAAVGGVALVATGAADRMGMANTASYALMGAMVGGPAGGAIGGLVGAFMDAKEAGEAYDAVIDRMADSSRSASTTFAKLTEDTTAGFDAMQGRIDDLATQDGIGDFLNDVTIDAFTELGRRVSGGKGLMEEAYGDIDATTQRWSNLTTVLRGVAVAQGDIVRIGTNLDAEKLGLDIGGPANVGWVGNLEDMGRVAASIEPVMQRLNLTWDDLFSAKGGDQVQLIKDINRELSRMDSDTGRIDAVADALADLDNGLLSTVQSTSALSTALSGLLDPKIDLSEQADKWIKSLKDLNEDVAKGSRTLKGNSDAALTNRDAIRSRVTQLKDTLTAQAAAGASSKELARSLNQQRESLMRAGIQAGMSKRELGGYLRELGLTPRLVRTTLRAVGIDTASAKVRELRRGYRNLPEAIQIQMRTKGVPKTMAEVNELVRNFKLTDKQRTALIRLKDQGAKKGTTDIKKLLEQVDKKDAKPKITVDGTRASATIAAVQARLDSMHDAYVTVHVTESRGGSGGGGGKGKTTEEANGGILPFADGGLLTFASGGGYGADGRHYARVPQIVAGGANVLWGEAETGWEAYISGKPSQRERNRGVWAEAGRRLGFDGGQRGVERITVNRTTVAAQSAQFPASLRLVVEGREFTAFVREHASDVATGQMQAARGTSDAHGRMNWG